MGIQIQPICCKRYYVCTSGGTSTGVFVPNRKVDPADYDLTEYPNAVYNSWMSAGGSPIRQLWSLALSVIDVCGPTEMVYFSGFAIGGSTAFLYRSHLDGRSQPEVIAGPFAIADSGTGIPLRALIVEHATDSLIYSAAWHPSGVFPIAGPKEQMIIRRDLEGQNPTVLGTWPGADNDPSTSERHDIFSLNQNIHTGQIFFRRSRFTVADDSFPQYELVRIEADGSNETTLMSEHYSAGVAQFINHNGAIDLDYANQKIILTQTQPNPPFYPFQVARVNFDGSGREVIYQPSIDLPKLGYLAGIQVDRGHEKIWVAQGAFSDIAHPAAGLYTIDLDGGNPEKIIKLSNVPQITTLTRFRLAGDFLKMDEYA